jgi:hypothetical protein
MAGSRNAGFRGTRHRRAEQLGLFTRSALKRLEREDKRLWQTLIPITIEGRVTLHLSLRTLRLLRRKFPAPPDPEGMEIM